jgi:hypothetical protein
MVTFPFVYFLLQPSDRHAQRDLLSWRAGNCRRTQPPSAKLNRGTTRPKGKRD